MEPIATERVNGASFGGFSEEPKDHSEENSKVPEEPEEKDIPLDDDEDEPQYEEEKLQVSLHIFHHFYKSF